jgi:hypothetical protein
VAAAVSSRELDSQTWEWVVYLTVDNGIFQAVAVAVAVAVGSWSCLAGLCVWRHGGGRRLQHIHICRRRRSSGSGSVGRHSESRKSTCSLNERRGGNAAYPTADERGRGWL